jgi:hypothetical protein
MAHRFQPLIARAFFFLACVLALSGRAESETASACELNFTVFSALPLDGLGFVPQPEAAPVPMVFYPTARSPHYFYHGPPRLGFFDLRTGLQVAEADVPAGIRTALLIFSATDSPGAGAPRFRVQLVDDSAASHGPGTLLILNLSGLTLAGTLGQRPIALRQGCNGPLEVRGATTLVLRTPFRGRSYQAYSETIPLEPSGRALLLLLPPYRAGSLEVQSRLLIDISFVEGR